MISKIFYYLLRFEHKVNHCIVKSNYLPAGFVKVYGSGRSRLGFYLYSSRFHLFYTSPNHIIANALFEGNVFIDVGAASGEMLNIARGAIGNNGQIFGFEPRNEAFDFLNQMFDRFGFSNISLFNSLVGDKDEVIDFFVDSDHPESSSVFREWRTGITDNIECRSQQMVSLDSWAEKIKPNRVDLLKIDVEGAEPQVIAGAISLILKTQPTILLEIRAINTEESMDKIFSFDSIHTMLIELGYTNFYALRKSGLALLDKFNQPQRSDHDMFVVNVNNERHIKILEKMIFAEESPSYQTILH